MWVLMSSADDAQLCLVSPSDPKVAEEILNWCQEEVMQWMKKANKMKLNPVRT